MSRFPWPKEVPVLTASDFVRDAISNNDYTKHCLSGWCRTVIRADLDNLCSLSQTERNNMLDLERKVNEELTQTAIQMKAAYNVKWCPTLKHACPADFNDCRKNTFTTLARIWNRTMAKLGYRVGNPEARYVRKEK